MILGSVSEACIGAAPTGFCPMVAPVTRAEAYGGDDYKEVKEYAEDQI